MFISIKYKISFIILCLFSAVHIKAQKQDSVRFTGRVYNETGMLVDTIMTIPLLAGGRIEIPRSMKTIGNESFYENKRIKHVFIPRNVETIGRGAFRGCSRLVEVSMEQPLYDSICGLKEIGSYAFSKCKRLKDISFPSTLRIINQGAFYECSNLKRVFIPATIDSIGYWSFCGCGAIESIVVDKGNKHYDSRDNCNAIINTENGFLMTGCKNTIAPKGVKVICDGAFQDVKGLKHFVVPLGTEAICRQVWKGCTDLKNVEFPASIEYVDFGIFDNCSNLKRVVINRKEPPECYLEPSDILDHATLYVPKGCVEKYQEADGWKCFGEIREISPEYPKTNLHLTKN